MQKTPTLVIVGPTASGKTALSVELAKRYNGEIISADSMQIYAGLDIATAKPTDAEKQGIPHYLLGFLDNERPFSVADFLTLARAAIAEISARGKLPIIVGGTGLYISSLIDNVRLDETPCDGAVRARLTKEAEDMGREAMLAKLAEVDEETAAQLHPNNITRIIRALEVFEVTGIPLSEQKRRSRAVESPYMPCIIGLDYAEREDLYDRINQRVDKMLADGLVAEATAVYNGRTLSTARQAIGYKELLPYLRGEALLSACVDKIKQETRRYAKRQLTWFRREERINWIFLGNIPNIANILGKCENIIANSKIM